MIGYVRLDDLNTIPSRAKTNARVSTVARITLDEAMGRAQASKDTSPQSTEPLPPLSAVRPRRPEKRLGDAR
jgi:hypothetical protein